MLVANKVLSLYYYTYISSHQKDPGLSEPIHKETIQLSRIPDSLDSNATHVAWLEVLFQNSESKSLFYGRVI